MKRTILLLAAAFMLTSVSAVAQNKIDKQGRRQGHWIRTDKDGSKIYEGDFIDGLETGVFTYFYHDGTVRIRNTYSVPGKQCLHEAYDEKGHLLARGEYNQRNRHGLWHFYNEDGILLKQASYNMGVKDGTHIIFEHNGDTAEVVTWKNGHRNGRWWKRMGKKGYLLGNYVRGGLDGKIVEYNDDGKLVREGHYRDGLKHGTYRFFENSGLVIDEQWTSGIMVDRKILLHTPEPRFVSIHDIACMAAQGHKTLVVLRDGTEIAANEASDKVFNRAGDELFALANRKNRIMVARHCVQGIGKDNAKREIVLLEPQPSFSIFPDEDGLKMIHSLQYGDRTPLETIDN